MSSQMLFGELAQVLETKGDWFRIKQTYDNYEGWIDQKQVSVISESHYNRYLDNPVYLNMDLIQIISKGNNVMFPIVLGSNIPHMINNTFFINDDKYAFNGNLRKFEPVYKEDDILENAYMYLNTPYLWGGRSPYGLDCSGFTQVVFKLSGIPLQRDSAMQATQGRLVPSLLEATPGNLAFFAEDDGRISHVGILLKHKRIIHCSGKVRVDYIDQKGIINNRTHDHTHFLKEIRSYV